MSAATPSIHLSELLGAIHTARCREAVAFYQGVLRDAARMAREKPVSFAIDVHSGRRLWSDDGGRGPALYDDDAPALDVITQAERREVDAAVRGTAALVERVADGDTTGLLMFNGAAFRADVRALDAPVAYPIKHYWPLALTRAGEADREKRWLVGRKQTPWQYLVRKIQKRSHVPCSETMLREHAELVEHRAPLNAHPLVAEIARLHDAGLTVELIRELQARYPEDEALKGLPEQPAAAGAEAEQAAWEGPYTTKECAERFRISENTWRNWAAGRECPRGLYIEKLSRGRWRFRNEAQ